MRGSCTDVAALPRLNNKDALGLQPHIVSLTMMRMFGEKSSQAARCSLERLADWHIANTTDLGSCRHAVEEGTPATFFSLLFI